MTAEADLGLLARTAAANAQREFPYALIAVLDRPEDLQLPRDRHPAFHGCYDWHSAVHAHWLLLRLLHDHPTMIDTGAVRRVLDEHLTPANLVVEVEVLRAEPSFERPYGWAWLLALAAECRPSDSWSEALLPAADAVADLVVAWLPRAGRPVRVGTHGCTAYALGLMLDAARGLARGDLVDAVEAYVRRWFVPDRDAPLGWEPSGHDFCSPGLSEADLVRRVLDPGAFGVWLSGFWPGLTDGSPETLLSPVEVTDRTDGQVGHLDGLNLSRSTGLAHLAAALPVDDPRTAVLQTAADRHRDAGLAALAEDGYLSTHWIGTFVLLALEPWAAGAHGARR